ncbi:MAG: chromosome segregation protein SMC [Deltaproteobacteria bacterium]
MKIKNLTIHGFKSFVDKVSIPFPLGTSAIIGPNGCGKSNIVDAIRWVLGEQNPRHLRGRLMEDVIFNGSDLRKPLGMAEVTLVFSNEGGIAGPKFSEFTEIEITRRLYRSGESEYLINKVPSRLRDIVDLFTDTGIGTRAYSIIEQGQVAWLVNAKPEERRVIFEEAAGINKFKHKKEAAIRRLDATKENLLRVNDIISEVKRQLNSLNRQAKKAERYKAIREELKAIEVRLACAGVVDAKERIKDAEQRHKKAAEEELVLKAELSLKEALSEKTKIKYFEAESENRAIKDRLFEIERHIQENERNNALAEARIDEIKRIEGRIAFEIEELNGLGEKTAKETDALNASLAAIQRDAELKTKLLEQSSNEHSSISAELKEQTDAERMCAADSLNLSTILSDIRHSLEAILKEEDALRLKLMQDERQADAILKELALKKETLAPMAENEDRLDREKEALELGLLDMKKSLEDKEMALTGQNRTLHDLRRTHSAQTARINTLEDVERNFENLKEGVRSVLLNKKEALRVSGIVADVIEANPGYEKAVEALLNEKLQYVLVESQSHGIEAINFLKKNLSGRGSFVPIKEIRTVPAAVAAGVCAFDGAKELIGEVRISSGYESIVEGLLGDAIVVPDMEAALEIWRANGMYRTIVTTEGEIIDAHGIITGGGAGAGGILSRRAETKRLSIELVQLEQKTGSLERQTKDADREISGLKASIEALKEKLHALELEKINRSSGSRLLTEEIARLENASSMLSGAIEDTAKRLLEAAGKKASISNERASLEERLLEIEGKRGTLKAGLTTLAQKKDEASLKVTELRVSLAGINERIEATKKEIAGKNQTLSDALGRIELKKAEIESGLKELVEKKKETEGIKSALENAMGKRQALSKQDRACSEAITSIDAELKGMDAGIKAVSSGIASMQAVLGRASVEITEIGLGLKNLKERMVEKYGVDIEGVMPEEGPIDAIALEHSARELKDKIAELGEVSLSALEEYAELETRHQFLIDQQADLQKSVDDLHAAVTKINRTTRERFKGAFDEINEKFKETFPRFFSGGHAELHLSEDADILEAGIEIIAQPPGKRLQNITLLSGGEKALTATSLIFSIFLIKPSPFCLLDEVDAPLDEANIDRFNRFVHEMSKMSQFMLVTHNKKTMEMADALYGVTMEEPGISKVLSVNLSEN